MERPKPIELPDTFKDLTGREWNILPYRTPSKSNRHLFYRTIVDAETLNQEYPESHMVLEGVILDNIREEELEQLRHGEDRNKA